MTPYTNTTTLGGKTITFSTGHLARQATGSCTVRCGDTLVLVTATVSDNPKQGADFMPLVCDYVEKTYAAGKIPGGFFKREGRPSEKETLVSRLLDRPIRPLFPKGYYHDVQVIATVLCIDKENDSDILAMIGASFALELSGAPFKGPVGAVRLGHIDGEFVLYPTIEQMSRSILDVTVAGNEYGITMVEGRADFVDEATFVKGLELAAAEIRNLVDFQKKMAVECGVTKQSFALPEIATEIEKFVVEKYRDEFASRIFGSTKQDRRKAISELRTVIVAAVAEKFPDAPDIWTKFGIEKAEKVAIRSQIFKTKKRIDGRGTEDIRKITCEPGFLPRTHGSAVFTRGETQALAVTTLGTGMDEQRIDALVGESFKSFMLHYNFPPFSTGEVKMLRSPGRREVGHGALAERALVPVLPKGEDFPYTIRIVSEVLESNGSSSMASVCSGSMSLMDAGAPIKEHVAGIAMGLMKEGDDFIVLSDILGDEDHIGDMDFKVCGTRSALTAVQMDIKIQGLSMEIMSKALDQARLGRLHILELMYAAIPVPRAELSRFAPRAYAIKIKPDRIRDLIGPGGKNIRSITDTLGVQIDIDEDQSGSVRVFAADAEKAEAAIEMIKKFTFEPEVGKIYTGKVVTIKDFGAFVNIAPGVDGLLHVSQMASHRVKHPSDEVKEGDVLTVKVLEVEPNGKIRLSRKELCD